MHITTRRFARWAFPLALTLAACGGEPVAEDDFRGVYEDVDDESEPVVLDPVVDLGGKADHLADYHDWRFSMSGASTGEGVNAATGLRLFNTVVDDYLKYGERRWGINLVWSNSDSYSVRLEKANPRDHRDVQIGERVALRFQGGGYVKYGERTWGINLVWSDTPVLEWEIRRRDASGPVQVGTSYGIYNRRVGDYLVYCERPTGVNLRWLKDCKARTEAGHEDENNGPITFTYYAEAQVIIEGVRPYTLNWNPGPGRRLTAMKVGSGIGFPAFVAHFMKPGYPFSQCGSPTASVSLTDGQNATAEQLTALFGSATPQGPLGMLACLTPAQPNQQIDRFPVTITYTRSN